MGSHGSRLTNRGMRTAPSIQACPGTPIVRPNPGFGAISMAGSIGTSDYHSLQVQLLRRAGKGLNSMVAYTFAKAAGDTDGGNFGSAYGAEPDLRTSSTWTPRVPSRASMSGIGCPPACSTTCRFSTAARDSPISFGGLAGQRDLHGADRDRQWRPLRQQHHEYRCGFMAGYDRRSGPPRLRALGSALVQHRGIRCAASGQVRKLPASELSQPWAEQRGPHDRQDDCSSGTACPPCFAQNSSTCSITRTSGTSTTA